MPAAQRLNRCGFVLVGGMALLSLWLSDVPSAWAVREPTPEELHVPTRQKLLPLDNAPPPGGWAKQSAEPIELQVDLTDKAKPADIEPSVVDAVHSYLGTEAGRTDFLGGRLSLGDLEQTYVATVPTSAGASLVYVQFQQKLPNGVPVDNTHLHVTVRVQHGRARIVSTDVQLAPGLLELPMASQLLPDPATFRPAAAKALGVDEGALAYLKRVARYIEGAWRITDEYFDGQHWIAVVDILTREMWLRDGLVYLAGANSIYGRVRGRGLLSGPYTATATLQTLDLKDLQITAGGVSPVYTSNAGMFVFPTLLTPTTVSATLLGRWASVTNFANPTLTLSGLATPAALFPLFFQPTGSSELDTAQVNGYYHTTVAHDVVRTALPPATLANLDFMLPVQVNLITPMCNAYFDPSTVSVAFIQATSGCVNSAYDTVVLHEYGHFVDHQAGSITNFALSEGWGDIVATYATHQPLIGQDFYGAGTLFRTADNTYQYPRGGVGEVHAVGQAWAGFAWHVRQQLIASLGLFQGVQVAQQLLIPTLLANSASIPAALWNVVLLDDNDSNLANGTPHLPEIVTAAQQHRLHPFWNASVVHITSPLHPSFFSQPGTITVTGTVASSAVGLPVQQARLEYGVGVTPTLWLPIVPTLTPGTTGTLGNWPVNGLGNNYYTVRLVAATTVSGIEFQDAVRVWIENMPQTPIVTNAAAQQFPAVSGNLIVWADDRHGDYEIYLYDLSTATEHRITTNPAIQANVDISGNRIVWQDNRNGNWDIYACTYNPTTGTCPEQQITTHPANQVLPAISGDKIVWQDARNPNPNPLFIINWDIYLYDLSSGLEQQITTDPSDQISPDISGNYIVWEDQRHWFPLGQPTGRSDIYLYDLNAGMERRITTNLWNQGNPAISGNRIVWEDARHPAPHQDIYLCTYNSNTGACPEQQVTTTPEAQNPAISGDRIVWEDFRDPVSLSSSFTLSDVNLYGCIYNAATGACPEQPWVVRPAEQWYPAIDGTRLVWGDFRNGNWDIYSDVVP